MVQIRALLKNPVLLFADVSTVSVQRVGDRESRHGVFRFLLGETLSLLNEIERALDRQIIGIKKFGILDFETVKVCTTDVPVHLEFDPIVLANGVEARA